MIAEKLDLIIGRIVEMHEVPGLAIGIVQDDKVVYAKGFGVKLIEHQEIKNILCSRFNQDVNSAILKMAKVPEGTEVIAGGSIRFPVILYKNVFIFPGIPEYMKSKFSFIRERFRSSEFHLKRLFLNSHESSFAEILNRLQNFPLVFETRFCSDGVSSTTM